MEWGTCLEAMEAALELEKTVNESLLELAKVADAKGDAHLTDFVDEFLDEQVEDISLLVQRIFYIMDYPPGCFNQEHRRHNHEAEEGRRRPWPLPL